MPMPQTSTLSASLLCLIALGATLQAGVAAGQDSGVTPNHHPAKPGLVPVLSWAENPSLHRSGTREATDSAAYARRQAMIRVLGELYLRAREDRHRRSPETWIACAALARQLGCSPTFCRVLSDMARDDISPRTRANLTASLGAQCRENQVDELSLRQWIELLPMPARQIRTELDTLPLGSLFRLRAEHPRTAPAGGPAAGTSGLADELLELMEAQQAALRSVQDTATADAAAQQILPIILHLDAMKETMHRQGLTLHRLDATPAQQTSFIHLRDTLTREWARLRDAGFYDSRHLMAIEGLMAVS